MRRQWHSDPSHEAGKPPLSQGGGTSEHRPRTTGRDSRCTPFSATATLDHAIAAGGPASAKSPRECNSRILEY
jgi:hypothetical protein